MLSSFLGLHGEMLVRLNKATNIIYICNILAHIATKYELVDDIADLCTGTDTAVRILRLMS